ncbi:hypothetical protein JCM10003_1748 [Bacteroides pyogenes JCM 10003]|nr:hypothetical protein JCM10003_1748 [Bacteroides pyogenes JCM 10003]
MFYKYTCLKSVYLIATLCVFALGYVLNESFAKRPGISFIKTIKLHAEVVTGLFLQQPKISGFRPEVCLRCI